MLGTPNLGSYEAVRWLTGYNPTQAKLSLLDITHGTDGIIDIVRAFPAWWSCCPFAPRGPGLQPARRSGADLKQRPRRRLATRRRDRAAPGARDLGICCAAHPWTRSTWSTWPAARTRRWWTIG